CAATPSTVAWPMATARSSCISPIPRWSRSTPRPARSNGARRTAIPARAPPAPPPLVVKDKVFIGISGGEFGVQCHVTAYDIKNGKQVWRAVSEGPDDQIMVDAEKTTDLGKPVGKDSSVKTWQGDQWKIGGGLTWGR